jgi:beta-galactosidase/beta-glucuronidase
MSYVKAGVVPDPNFDMNMMYISDTFFYSDWWYRTSFDVPADRIGQNVYLNFNGVNWKAKIFINGRQFSGASNDIEGAFIRGKLDISDYISAGKNYLAVRVSPPEHYATPHSKTYSKPNNNGGLLGADNPTFHASINWDWVPTIRGRDTGIYDSVFLSYSGGVDLVDPWVDTNFDKLRSFSDNDLLSDLTPGDDPAYDFSKAHTTLKTEVKNTMDTAVSAVVSCTYEPGGLTFSSPPVSVAPGETIPVTLNADILDPKIWWPNGYGEQPLYTATVKVSVDGAVKDVNTFRFGVRKLVFTYTPATGSSFPDTAEFNQSRQSDSALNVFCNGIRIFCRGGNWGMDDSNVDLTYEDYRVRVKLHAEENFTMIRNWVGQTMKEAFYDACDEYGILVWDDFWLANPWDGPDPLDNEMFLKNAEDKIKVVRKHPSLAIYCTRNEATVARPLDSGLQTAITNLDGTRAYVRSSDSAVFGINGHGPYTEQERKAYFYGSNSANFQLHTERGQHVIANPEVLKKYFRPENMFPGFTAASTLRLQKTLYREWTTPI